MAAAATGKDTSTDDGDVHDGRALDEHAEWYNGACLSFSSLLPLSRSLCPPLYACTFLPQALKSPLLLPPTPLNSDRSVPYHQTSPALCACTRCFLATSTCTSSRTTCIKVTWILTATHHQERQASRLSDRRAYPLSNPLSAVKADCTAHAAANCLECRGHKRPAFCQLLYQGTKLVPTDFLTPATSHNPLCGSLHHRILISNYFAPPKALALDKTEEQVHQVRTPLCPLSQSLFGSVRVLFRRY